MESTSRRVEGFITVESSMFITVAIDTSTSQKLRSV